MTRHSPLLRSMPAPTDKERKECEEHAAKKNSLNPSVPPAKSIGKRPRNETKSKPRS